MKKAATKSYYDRLSRWYDLFAGQAEKKCKQQGLLLLNVHPGETVLEIGFGTGHCLQALAQSVGDTGKVYGVDLSDGMLQVAQTRLHKAGLLGRVELRPGRRIAASLADNFFDALYMSFTLELFDSPEIPVLLMECKRVLHANGRICIVSHGQKRKRRFNSQALRLGASKMAHLY